jgi:hypothetical protein
MFYLCCIWYNTWNAVIHSRIETLPSGRRKVQGGHTFGKRRRLTYCTKISQFLIAVGSPKIWIEFLLASCPGAKCISWLSSKQKKGIELLFILLEKKKITQTPADLCCEDRTRDQMQLYFENGTKICLPGEQPFSTNRSSLFMLSQNCVQPFVFLKQKNDHSFTWDFFYWL